MNLFIQLLTLISCAPANRILARCIKAGVRFDDAQRIIQIEARVEGADSGPWAWGMWQEEGHWEETPWGGEVWRGKRVWNWITCTGETRFKVWETPWGEFKWEMEREGFRAWGSNWDEGGWWSEEGCGWIGDWRRESMEEILRVEGGVEVENPDLREAVEKFDRQLMAERVEEIWEGNWKAYHQWASPRKRGYKKSRKRQSNYRSEKARFFEYGKRETRQ